MNMNHLNQSPRHMKLLEAGVEGIFQTSSEGNSNINLLNTLFHYVYPHGHIARLSLRGLRPPVVPAVLDEVLSGIRWGDIAYMPVGSRHSVERQEIYFVDELTHAQITERFQGCKEALISQFDLFVAACDIVSEQDDLTVMVVPNDTMGINDWHGWVRRTILSKFGLPEGKSHYRFAMSFGNMQAKGEMSVMDDAIADRHRADIIIPKKSFKPIPGTGFCPLPSNKLVGRIVLGFKEYSSEQQASDRIKVLDEHVCKAGCRSSDSQAIRHALIRAFRVPEMYVVQHAGK
jgi:hypothetical protein